MTSGSLLQFLKTKRRNTLAGDKAKKANKVRTSNSNVTTYCFYVMNHLYRKLHGNVGVVRYCLLSGMLVDAVHT